MANDNIIFSPTNFHAFPFSETPHDIINLDGIGGGLSTGDGNTGHNGTTTGNSLVLGSGGGMNVGGGGGGTTGGPAGINSVGHMIGDDGRPPPPPHSSLLHMAGNFDVVLLFETLPDICPAVLLCFRFRWILWDFRRQNRNYFIG